MIPSRRQYPSTLLSVPVHLNALTNSTIKQTKRRVRFNPSVTVQPINCKMSSDSSMYYSMAELDAMSLEAKTDYAKSQEQTTESDTPSSTSLLVVDPALRGLEFKSCPRRVYQKILSTKALLKYQKALASDPLKTNEERLFALAKASSKLSKGATIIAIETARLDSVQVRELQVQARLDSKQVFTYNYLIPIRNESILLTAFPGQKKQRRLSSRASGIDFPNPVQGQKKRRRLSFMDINSIPSRRECVDQ